MPGYKATVEQCLLTRLSIIKEMVVYLYNVCVHLCSIFRYSWKGSPLLITEHPAPEDTLQCKFCGSLCVFEFQLMPPLVYLLQKSVQERTNHSVKLTPSAKISRLDTVESEHTGRESGLVPPPPAPPVEFGTVLVYSCCKSCWEDVGGAVFREEWVLVQPEPDDCINMCI